MSAEADGTEPGDDQLPDPEIQRERFAERLREAGVSTQRFIDVLNGKKGTRTPGHQDPENWLGPRDDRLSGNYGIHPGFGLLEIDRDDYDGDGDTEALDDCPTTASVISPHTDPDQPGHRYYVIDDDDARSVLLKHAGTLNPDLSWGEIKYEGKYVVGPGSQLDGCSKEWCDECAKPDGGYYRIGNDEPIAELDPDDLAAILQADPDVNGAQPNATDVFDVDDDDTADADAEDDGGGDDRAEIDDEWMGPADLRDALRHIDPDVGNDEWVRVGFAIGEWFGRDETEGDLDDAKELFAEWSGGEIASWHEGVKWDQEAKGRVSDIISRARLANATTGSGRLRSGRSSPWRAVARTTNGTTGGR